MEQGHPLGTAMIVRAVERVMAGHVGRRWAVCGFTALDDLASNPTGILHGETCSVFAKLVSGPGARARLDAELDGLDLLARAAGVRVPVLVGGGLVDVDGGMLLLTEAVVQRLGADRTARDWIAIGHALATIHQVVGPGFGHDRASFFGPWRQDNRPVATDRWYEFYRSRRVEPMLRAAVDSGHLPAALARGVRRLCDGLPELTGPEPLPHLLHGDAQQNNFVSTADGVLVVDPAVAYGHPEIDLALVDYFAPVPALLFDAYREVRPLDPGFAQRRELWRLFAYLAVVAGDGDGFGRPFVARVAEVVRRYSSCR